jgi:F-type H+-transporting ATPase subunit beta
VPEQAFFLIGGLEDLAKKAEGFGVKLEDGGQSSKKKDNGSDNKDEGEKKDD